MISTADGDSAYASLQFGWRLGGQLRAAVLSGFLMTLLLIALGLALLYAALKPLGDGLFDTSAWVAKILAPAEIEQTETTKRLSKFGQAALTEGWLSNIPFIAGILFWCSIILSFFYDWWAAIAMYFVATVLGVLTKLFWRRSASFYLSLIEHKMLNSAADYKRCNDTERLEVAESYCKDLQRIILLYEGSGLRPPTPKQLKDIPSGDLSYWLDAHVRLSHLRDQA